MVKPSLFLLDKIVRAITKAFRAGGITDEGQAVEQIASDVAAAITKAEISVEEIQDMVEEREADDFTQSELCNSN